MTNPQPAVSEEAAAEPTPDEIDLGKPPYYWVEQLPSRFRCQLIDGALYTQPRPRVRHGRLAVGILSELVATFDRERPDADRWTFIIEPELHLVFEHDVYIPDLAGWRPGRSPGAPETYKIAEMPDWICEVLSPSTESLDRRVKLPMYGRHGIPLAWLADPETRTIEGYRWDGAAWQPTGSVTAPATVALPPFEATGVLPWPTGEG